MRTLHIAHITNYGYLPTVTDDGREVYRGEFRDTPEGGVNLSSRHQARERGGGDDGGEVALGALQGLFRRVAELAPVDLPPIVGDGREVAVVFDVVDAKGAHG